MDVREEILEIIGSAAVVLAIVIGYFIKRHHFRWMRTFDFSPVVDEKLSQYGITMISLRLPEQGTFNPFDRDRVKLEASFSSIGAMKEGQSIKVAEYRVATCYDSSGKQFDLWVQIDSEPRITGERSIQFRSQHPEELPPKVQLFLS